MADASASHLGGVAKVVLDVRMVAVLLTIIWLPTRSGRLGWLVAALCLVGVASFGLLWWWDRLGSAVVRHPSWLAAELVLASLILAAAGPSSPFLYFTLGTAFLGGLFYRVPGTALFTALLVAAYYWSLDLHAGVAGGADGFDALFGTPTLYLLAGVGGALVRRLLDRQAEAETALARVRATAAAAEERVRLAREMHDSLAKTIQGIALSARALERRSRSEPAAQAPLALALALAAETAAVEARSLIIDLRADRLDMPLPDAVAAQVRTWSLHTGTPVTLNVEPADLDCPHARYELLCIGREALANVERHADATRVVVELTSERLGLQLRVVDDGRGFSPSEAAHAESTGHFGLVGMQERAERAGGSFTVETSPGGGTTVVVRVPSQKAELASVSMNGSHG